MDAALDCAGRSPLAGILAQEAATTTASPSELDKLGELLKKFRFAMLTTRTTDDKLTAHPLTELWNPAVEAWFPDGPDDPNVVLLKVDALSGEYWDSPGGKVATLVSLVKSKITGEAFEADNEKFDL